MRGVVDTCSPRPTTRCNTVATPCYTGVRVVISPCGRPSSSPSSSSSSWEILLHLRPPLLLGRSFFISVLLLFFISVLLLFFISVLLLFFILVLFFFFLSVFLYSFISFLFFFLLFFFCLL